MIPILHNVFKKIEAKRTFSNLLYETTMTLTPKPDKDIIRQENYKQVYLVNIGAKLPNKTLAN